MAPLILAELTLNAALAAAATLVATRSRLPCSSAGWSAAAATSWPGRSRSCCSRSASRRAVAGRGRRLAPASFRVFFLFGAVLNVPWLALGTVYLLAGRRLADGVRWGLVIGRRSRPGVMVDRPDARHRPDRRAAGGRDLFAPLPRILAAVGSGVAARRRHRRRAVVGVAAVAATAGRDQPAAAGRVSPSRLALGNVIIAAGTWSSRPAARSPAGSGKDTAFALTLVIGVVILFSGFLVATPGRVSRADVYRADAAAPRRPGPRRARRRPSRPRSAGAPTSAGRAAGPCRDGSGAARRRTGPSSGTCSGPGAPGSG